MVVVNTSTAYKPNIKYRVKAQDATGTYDDSLYSDALSVDYFSVTKSLTNLTINTEQQMVASGYPYNAVITAGTGYIITDDSWAMTIDAVIDKTKGTISSDGKTLTISVPNVTGNIVIGAWGAMEQLSTPTIAMNTDGRTLEITDVSNATSYDVYADGSYKANVEKGE